MSKTDTELEQVEVDDQLRELALCWQIFAKASAGIMYYPVNGDRVSMVNEACARMHGYSREEMQNLKLQDLDAADLTQLSPSRRQRLLAGENLIFEAEHYHKDGHTFPLEVSATLVSLVPRHGPEISGRRMRALTQLFSAGRAQEMIADLLHCDPFVLEFQHDITERKRSAEAVLKTRVFESLGALAGGIAHHLNNLLQGLLGNISLARLYTPRSSQAFEFLANALDSHATALQLKDQLAALATGGPAVWDTLESGDLFREFALSPAGNKPAQRVQDWPDELPVGRESAATDLWEVKNLPATGGRILIMDDEPAVLEVATEFLQYVGYRVDGVVNGEEAVQAYQRALESGDPYGAVILDLFIDAGMGGQEAMEMLGALDPQVKAIISSGNSSDPLVTNYAAYGFTASLLKPYRLEQLETTLARLLLS